MRDGSGSGTGAKQGEARTLDFLQYCTAPTMYACAADISPSFVYDTPKVYLRRLKSSDLRQCWGLSWVALGEGLPESEFVPVCDGHNQFPSLQMLTSESSERGGRTVLMISFSSGFSLAGPPLLITW